MDRQDVRSSTIRSIGYDAETSVLEVEFHRRGTYRYFDVPEFLHRGLMLAASKGSFFNDRIAERYRHEEVRER